MRCVSIRSGSESKSDKRRSYLSSNKVILLFAVIILIAFSIYSLMVGSVPLSLAQVEQYFLGHATATQTIILSDIRIPRTVIAIVAGAALSLSGLLLQTVTRNSLSCPTILGVGQGSALTALIILLCVPTIELNTYFLLVIFGGLVSFAFIYLFSISKKLSITRLVLVGVTFNALFYAVSYLLLVVFPARAQSLLFILNGSIAGVNSKQEVYLVVITLFCLILTWVFRHKLKLLSASAETLTTLGVSAQKTALLFIIIAVVLSSSVVGVVGPVFFFGLVVPHITKLLMGRNSHNLILASALFGSILMLVTDVFIRSYFSGFEISIGIVFAFLSAPFLVALLRVAKL